MQGTVSFHPVALDFFTGIVGPLAMAGEKVDPEPLLAAAVRHHRAGIAARGVVSQLVQMQAALEPPPPPAGAGAWTRLRTWMERIDHRPPPESTLVGRLLQPDLHLRGRPFFIAEVGDERVVAAVDAYLNAPAAGAAVQVARQQVARLHADLEAALVSDDDEGAPDLEVRADLMAELRDLHRLAGAARRGEMWSGGDGRAEPALEVLCRDFPWMAMRVHSRAVPFWIGDDVDGLETLCRLADVPAPLELVPAWPLFAGACAEFPALRETLGTEITAARRLGAYAAPENIQNLMEFLRREGGAIIRAASRAGDGTMCANLLRKIRECTTYALAHGLGYLEASSLEPPLSLHGADESADA